MEVRSYIWALVVLAMVLGLIGGTAWLLKRTGLLPGASGMGRPGRRLRVVEVTPLDVKRKLVLVRRDQVEHLILLGAQSDLVVESGIRSETGESEKQAPTVAAGRGGA